PRGSRNKFKFEPASGKFRLSKVLPEGMVFPHDFGFVPYTTGEDGDPLDVLVLMDEATFPGCVVQCKLIGVIEAQQGPRDTSKRNDRLIAVAQQSLLYSGMDHIRELTPTLLRQIEAFFVNYQKVRNVKYTILTRRGPEKALRLLKTAAS